jgi:hypothetical protein
MEPGPSTVRTDADPASVADRLRAQHLAYAVITSPDGMLLGIAPCDELERAR